MTILALEFSSERRSVALSRDGRLLAEAAQQTESRATDALGMIEKVLADVKISRDAIEAIAVGLGPGSYTGIRAAIAVAQGWQLARNVKLLGVSNADSFAAQAQAEKIFGRVNVVIDAQRNEFYLATWDISETAREIVTPLKIVTAAEIAARQAAGEVLIGPKQDVALFPQAAMIARLAAGRTDFCTGEQLEPIYLRETNFVKVGSGQLC
jgi:tRNA threonylcarbamoyladenosine biosynthesis protein TsaB